MIVNYTKDKGYIEWSIVNYTKDLVRSIFNYTKDEWYIEWSIVPPINWIFDSAINNR